MLGAAVVLSGCVPWPHPSLPEPRGHHDKQHAGRQQFREHDPCLPRHQKLRRLGSMPTRFSNAISFSLRAFLSLFQAGRHSAPLARFALTWVSTGRWTEEVPVDPCGGRRAEHRRDRRPLPRRAGYEVAIAADGAAALGVLAREAARADRARPDAAQGRRPRDHSLGERKREHADHHAHRPGKRDRPYRGPRDGGRRLRGEAVQPPGTREPGTGRASTEPAESRRRHAGVMLGRARAADLRRSRDRCPGPHGQRGRKSSAI